MGGRIRVSGSTLLAYGAANILHRSQGLETGGRLGFVHQTTLKTTVQIHLKRLQKRRVIKSHPADSVEGIDDQLGLEGRFLVRESWVGEFGWQGWVAGLGGGVG